MAAKKTKTKDLLVNFVIDGSGSMAGLRQATIDGFNSFIESELSMDVGETHVTTTVFSDKLNPVCVGMNAKKLPLFGTPELPYTIGGMTALYDAVGVAVEGARQWVKNNNFKGKVLTVIWTDGMENSSREWSIDNVNALIEEMQAKGWVFQFMGTGEAGWLSGKAFSAIEGAPIMCGATAIGQSSSYVTLNSATSALRSTGTWVADQAAYNATVAANS